jgi:hypothetical protein
MTPKKTLREREKELRALLPIPEGRVQIQELAARYAADSGNVVPKRGSLITYILVFERQRGLIGDGT